MGSAIGISDEKLLDVIRFEESKKFDEREQAALRYADAITLSELDVSDELFADLSRHFDEDQIVELTAVIAWENASSKFNRALRVESQDLWHRSSE